MNVIISILVTIGSLGIFLYGMKLMSESLQKMAGNQMRNILSRMTPKPFNGILTAYEKFVVLPFTTDVFQ